MNEFEIFKAGTHTSSNGTAKDYSIKDLEFIASSYNPAENEAPIVIGHPVDNSPAYGWIESLKVAGDRLLAKPKEVIKEFSEAVKKGLYKKRSISLDKDGKLRHVGFLGGAAPAVKGLADIQFNEPSALTYELDLDPRLELKDEGLKENAKDEKATAKDVNTQDNIVNEPVVDDKPPLFSEQLNQIRDNLIELNKKFVSTPDKTNTSDISKIQSAVDDLSFKINFSAFEPMLNDKLSSGSLTPAMKKSVMSLFEYLNTQNFSAEYDYSQFRNDVKKLLTDFVESVPKIVYYENFAEKPDETDNDSNSFSGYTLDEESAALHKKAKTIMRKDNISYEAAVMKLSKLN